MISLKEYKNHLINFYEYEIDNNPNKRNERKIELERKYNNNALKKIIFDTYDFINDIFICDTINHGYCYFELGSDTTSYISLVICGGGCQDTIYTDLKGRNISKYILKNIFGNNFSIEVKEEERLFYSDNDLDVVGIDIDYLLYMQGFPRNMKEIKENLFGKSKQLKK